LRRDDRSIEHALAILQANGEEDLSVDGALATLLAEGRPDLTPFTAFSQQALRVGGVDLVVTHYKREDAELVLDKSAVVFTVTNGGTGPWALDEVRLMAEPYMQARPFAMRASARVITPGSNARIAVVIPTDALKSGPDGDRLVLELWRAGVGRQVKVDLVAVDDSLIPSSEPHGRPR